MADHTTLGHASHWLSYYFIIQYSALKAMSFMQVADDEIYLVVNAGCREKDLAHIGKHMEKYKVRSTFSPPKS